MRSISRYLSSSECLAVVEVVVDEELVGLEGLQAVNDGDLFRSVSDVGKEPDGKSPKKRPEMEAASTIPFGTHFGNLSL